ncbi:ATP-dependent helicase [Patescibacteria group bacterium]|nr:ATP-dependent helicase [Patescibacteria group bacterium]
MKEFILTGAQGSPDLKIDYKAELNEEQLAVVEHPGGPVLVLAGAGSGKTRTVTYRVAWLLEHGVQPDRMLLLTFTNKAAKEMATRVEALLKVYPQGLWSGTFHSIANRILRMYGDRTEYGRDFSIMDDEDSTDLMKLCIKDEVQDARGKRFPSANVLKGIISFATNARISLPQAIERRASTFTAFEEEIIRIARTYQDHKLRQKTMDFDDLLNEWLKLLETHPEVCSALSNRFEYIFVDEYQDTNAIQAEIVYKLAEAHKNLTVVGDDAQSIYSFRAAEIRNILDFPKRFPEAVMQRLVVNYRSTPEILAVANAVIANNGDQFEKELVAASRSGEKPNVVPAADQQQEAQFVAEQMLQLINEGERMENIAVLFRAAFHSQALEFELMKRNIPYEYRGGLKFFERAHVKDALAHLRVLRNVKDEMAWMRALQIQDGFGLATAAKVANQAAMCDSAEQASQMMPKLGAKAQAGWQRAAKIIGVMARATSPGEALRRFAGSETYKEYLESEYQNSRERLEDLEQFGLFADQYDELGAFLDAVTLTGEAGGLSDPEKPPQQTETSRVILSTIHQAKGLEWNTVFVLNLAEGAFPSQRSYDEAGMEEERRLFYVAATRARRKLFLTYPITSGFDHLELRQPSPFLDEIPKDAIETIKLRAAPRFGGGASSYYANKYAAPKSGRSARFSDDDEPTIVLNDLGEQSTPKRASPGSFLRDIDEL